MYFWHYNGPERGRQAVLYCGAAGHAKTRDRALQLLLDHEERARVALGHRIAKYRSALDRSRGG